MRCARSLLLSLLIASPALAAPPQHYLQSSWGTGFFINRDGHFITNAHVVRGCQSIELHTSPPMMARIVAHDDTRDLAVLQAIGPAPAIAPLRWNIDDLQPGDPVAVYGFPGTGASGIANYWPSQVLSLQGPKGEANLLQLTTPVDKGGSGGPVLDRSGHVIAVVAGRIELYREPTSTDSNLTLVSRTSIAVTLRALQDFLDQQKISYYRAASGIVAYADEALARNSRDFIAPVKCYQGVVAR